MLDALILSPHPDDAEISVGGTIRVLLAQGLKVGVTDLTSGEPTPYGSPDKRQAETAAATEVLGLPYRNNLGLPNRSLVADLAARRAIAEEIRKTRPRLIFAPYWEDAHPDHGAATQLIEAARFWAKLSKSDLEGEPHFPERVYYYYSIHLRVREQPSFVIDISEHIETKLAAVRCYESQFIENRDLSFPSPLDDIKDRARYWGWSIGTAYGEPLKIRETVGLPTLPEFVTQGGSE